MILLDALIAYLDGKITLKSLKTDVSSFLRKYAVYRGIEIDDKFRNENGIAMQLWVMEYYFTGGKHGLKKDQCPKIFQEAIDLYHQDRKEFERILREAKAMNQNDKKEQFFVWLSSKVPASNLSDFYLAYDFIENYAKDSGILKTELISIKTKDELISLSKNLQSSSFFRNVSSRDRFYIGQILIYLEEYSIHSNVPVVKKEPVITNRAKTIITSKPKSITATVSPDHIDFMNLQDYVYTKPYEYIYAGETIQVRSWRMLYMSVVKCLLRDYPDKILNLKNGSITRSGAIDICDSKSVYRLRTAGKLGDDLYIEVNLSAKNIAQRIKYLLDICNVSYGNLVIRLKKDDTSAPMEQPKPKEKNVTAVGATPVDKPVQTLSKPPTPSSKQPIYSDSTQKTNHKSVDFTIPASYSFTLPIQFVYFGEVHSVKTWKEVYIGVLACLLEDYPNVFIKLKNKPTENNRVPIIFGKTKSSSLRTPALIGNNLYVETNRRTDHFIRCMKIILDLCKVDYENIIIEYDELSGETSEKGKDASKPEKTAMTKKSTTNNDFVDQAAFYTYLIDVQKISESTCRGYVSALKRAEQFAREERLASCQLLNCSQSEARKTIDALNGNEKFRIFNNEQHHRFSAAIAKLIAFFDLPDENAGVVPSTDSVKTVDLESFLKGDEFAPLLKELVRHKITTIEELKKLKLWAFMNRNNIYSIGTRQRIFTKVNDMLYPAVDLNETQAYILHIGYNKYNGTIPAKAFIAFCADMLIRYPLQFRTLIGARMTGSSIVPVARNKDESHTLKVANVNAFVSENMSVQDVILYTGWVRKKCGEGKIDITMTEPENATLPAKSGSTEGGIESKVTTEASQSNIDISSKTSNIDVEKMEQFVLDADIEGITYEELKMKLHTTMVATKQAVGDSVKIVEVRGRLIHEEAFVDWEVGANHLEMIIEKLLSKNDGYLSSAQLYEYVKMEMNMFLTDNNVNDERAVYDIAEHLFGKKGYHGKRYCFYGKAHISRSEHRVTSNLDIIRNYASDQGGIFSFDALVEYLQRIGISTGNLRAQMKIPTEPIFFYYDEGIIMCADDMHIDDRWKADVKKKIEILLDDNGGYIILRSIPKIWLEQLPVLPGRKPWTPLLLQSILRCYGTELGAKTIQAMSGQSIDTLHTMLVSDNSPLQNFGDVIISYLIDNEIKRRSFKAEDLRLLLVDAGIIKGNELLWNMPKVLDKDERFAWDASGDRVIVEV